MSTEENAGGTSGTPSAMGRTKEQKLIKAAAAGDMEAATALIRAHQGGVFCYIKRMCGHDDIAEDVTQEAFSRVLLNLDRFDFNYRFSTWLFTIARRIYLNMREKKRPVSDSDRLQDSFAISRDVGDGLEQGEFRAKSRDLLQRALLTLAPEQREIVVLFHQHDWPIWMIADQLGCPEGTVKSHLFRGRLKLRDEYLRLEEAARVLAVEEKNAARKAAAASLNTNRTTKVQVIHEQSLRDGTAHPPGTVMRSVPVNAKSSIMQAVQPGDSSAGITHNDSASGRKESNGRSAQSQHLPHDTHSLDEVDRAQIEEELSKSGIFAAIPLRTDASGKRRVHGETWS